MTSSSAVGSVSNSDLLNSYIQQSQAGTAAAHQQMANNVSNGVNAAATSSVTGNFNTFLKILTTQLQNQDPTAPMDTNQFTQELVEFSGVEQQLNTNNLLQKLVTASGAGGVKSLLGYVNQYVEVPANGKMLMQNGVSNMAYVLPTAAQTVKITVKDSTGATVATLTGPTNLGLNRISWNGQDQDGNQLPDGAYSLTIAATDSGGNNIPITDTRLTGLVTGVQSADDQGNDLLLGPNLTVNDTTVDSVFTANSLPQHTDTNSNSSTPSS